MKHSNFQNCQNIFGPYSVGESKGIFKPYSAWQIFRGLVWASLTVFRSQERGPDYMRFLYDGAWGFLTWFVCLAGFLATPYCALGWIVLDLSFWKYISKGCVYIYIFTLLIPSL
jgi:hypothetical protein